MCTKYNPLELGEYQCQQKTFTLVLYTCKSGYCHARLNFATMYNMYMYVQNIQLNCL